MPLPFSSTTNIYYVLFISSVGLDVLCPGRLLLTLAGEDVFRLLLQVLRRHLLRRLEHVHLGEREAERVHVTLGGRRSVVVLGRGHVERVDAHVVVHRQEERNVGEVVEEVHL